MKRFTFLIIAAAVAIFLSDALSATAFAQRGGAGVGRGRGFLGGPGRVNRRPQAAFGGGGGFFGGATLFDLYRTGRIPIPPYFALHPPVYYSGIDYQQYGVSPFAYPYTWWQQYGYGSPNVGSPYENARPMPESFMRPVIIDNPHVGEEVSGELTDSQRGVQRNKYVQADLKSKSSKSVVYRQQPQPAVIMNPYVVGKSTHHGIPIGSQDKQL